MADEPRVPLGYCTRCAAPLVTRPLEGFDRPTCPACGYVVYLDPKVAVAVVIGDASGVLLVRRGIEPGAGAWSFPAGYVNRGEVVEEAAVRELLEELNVEVRLERLVGVYSRSREPVVLVVYSGSIIDGELAPDDVEVREVGYFPVGALPPLAFPHDPKILADWERLTAVRLAP